MTIIKIYPPIIKFHTQEEKYYLGFRYRIFS